MTEAVAADVAAYLDTLNDDARAAVDEVRRRTRRLIDEPGEKISYKIIGLTERGKIIIYLAGWAQHIALYPVPDGDADLAADLAPYRHNKSTLHFPLRDGVPYELIDRVITAASARTHPSP